MNFYKACKIITDLDPMVDVAVSYVVALECVLTMLELNPNGCTKKDLKRIDSFNLLPKAHAKRLLIDIIEDGHAKKVGKRYLFIEDFGQVFGGDK